MTIIDHIRSAIHDTYQFTGWKYKSEAEFKHELFHRLALRSVNGVRLSDAESGMTTCRLHAEAKVENGNAKKADLVICDPSGEGSDQFNYKVEHIIELKKRFNSREIGKEIEKLNTYKKPYSTAWFVSAEHVHVEKRRVISKPKATGQLYIEFPESSPGREIIYNKSDMKIEKALKIVEEAIFNCLSLYGSNKKQYKSFFWCNYEHEQERHHSYPCEGDFNAQLYHQFRLKFPPEIIIRSEYSPSNLPGKRIDLVVENPSENWSIPIEVKMNWDQFKPKYKDRKPMRSEAKTIIDKFQAVYSEKSMVKPILVVIQGEWRLSTRDNRGPALADLERSNVSFKLARFDENGNEVKWKSF